MPCFFAHWVKKSCRDGRTSVSTNVVRLCIVTVFLLFATSLLAQDADSVQQQRLDEVIIASERPVRIAADAAAVQQLSAKQIEALPTLQLSDALKYMSGVVVKDYGVIDLYIL